MHLLLTRPQGQSEALAEKIAALGATARIEPLLRVVHKDGPPIDLTDVQALLFTSANGVRAFVHRQGTGEDCGVPVLAVGDATAREAREAGFVNVRTAGGDVSDLAALAAGHLSSGNGPLVHVAATHVAGDLAGALEDAGFVCRREVLYETEAAVAFSPETGAAFSAGELDGVLLYSPRTAATFRELFEATAADPRNVTVYCLSANVRDAATGPPWRGFRVAAAPTEAALLNLLGEDLGGAK